MCNTFLIVDYNYHLVTKAYFCGLLNLCMQTKFILHMRFGEQPLLLHTHSMKAKTKYLRNEFNFWNVHGIMNTSGLLQSKCYFAKDLKYS